MNRSFFLLVLAVAASGCAQEAETPVRDSCKLRDCGPVSGGNTDAEEEEDTSAEFDTEPELDAAEDSGVVVDSAPEAAAETGGCKVPPGKTCSTFPQCGCASGLNCEVTASDGNRSCVTAGTKKLHEACADLGDCEKGLSCGLFGLCVPFCEATADCPASTMECRQAQASAGDAGVVDIPGYKTCESKCDPINPSKACGSASCAFYDDASTVCIPVGPGTTMASCKKAACAAGYTCIGAADCHRWCRVGFAGDCPGGKACSTFSDHPKLGGVEYGYCAY